EEDFAAAGLGLATSLAVHATERPVTREVAKLLLGQLDEEYDRLHQGDLATLEACWKWHLGLLGREVIAEFSDGARRGRLLELGFRGVVLESADRSRLALLPEAILHLSRT